MYNIVCVFPAHAGVFLLQTGGAGCPERLPRARGGVSSARAGGRSTGLSSPRTRGCFLAGRFQAVRENVFPAHAGVFLGFIVPLAAGPVSSPRTRGCFHRAYRPYRDRCVFPAHAGVFLLKVLITSLLACLPRARGGVSES